MFLVTASGPAHSEPETDWDLEPFAEVLHLDTCLSSNKILRNYEGLKITTCMPN